jgi:hypothetical protein
MPLSAFDSRGDLPVGVHPATLAEVITRDKSRHGIIEVIPEVNQ